MEDIRSSPEKNQAGLSESLEDARTLLGPTCHVGLELIAIDRQGITVVQQFIL
jgi:hypothetical protein